MPYFIFWKKDKFKVKENFLLIFAFAGGQFIVWHIVGDKYVITEWNYSVLSYKNSNNSNKYFHRQQNHALVILLVLVIMFIIRTVNIYQKFQTLWTPLLETINRACFRSFVFSSLSKQLLGLICARSEIPNLFDTRGRVMEDSFSTDSVGGMVQTVIRVMVQAVMQAMGEMVRAVMWVMGSGRWRFMCSPTAHLLLCGLAPNRKLLETPVLDYFFSLSLSYKLWIVHMSIN